MASNLKSIGLANLDSICNGPFVKTLKFKTKKELIVFLQDDENAEDLAFLKGLDQQVIEKHASIGQEIKAYFLTIIDKLNLYREEIKKQESIKRKEAKERKAQENKELEELNKQKIIEEYLAKESLKKEQEDILKRNGLLPKPKLTSLKNESPALSVKPQRQSTSQEVKKTSSAEEIVDQIIPKPTSNQEIELGLKDYFRIAQQLVKEDLFQVYTDTGEMVEVQCLMMEGERIKMIIKSE